MKRKRSDVDESDPKLKEFLEVMQPASKPKIWANKADDSITEPPTKMQAIEVPEGESDEEYEAVPKKSRRNSVPKVTVAPLPSVVEQPQVEEVVADPVAPNATDDDWLRSRTNRLLDLMDPEEIGANGSGAKVSAEADAVAEMTVEEPSKNADIPEEQDAFEEEEAEEDKPDPIIEAIKTNGRLFVRNLPYSASEEDLRRHFEPFGSLEEVCVPAYFLSSLPLLLYDEYPDRDSLCLKHMMRTGRIF